jgi:hypothetical protein
MTLIACLDQDAEAKGLTRTSILEGVLEAYYQPDEPVKIELLVGGQPLPSYPGSGSITRYVESPASGTYEISLRNPSPHRVLAVLSVDGLSVMDGQPASDQSGGYVLGPYQTTTIKGWRRTDTEVAAFAITPVTGSYSEQMGFGSRNVGVVGLMVFHEKQVMRSGPSVKQVMDSMELEGVTRGWPISSPKPMQATASTAPRGGLLSVEPTAIGTGYGAATEMRTSSTTFVREAAARETVTLRYGTRAQLEAWGVKFVTEPNPFPGAPSVPAPPGWRG